MKIKDCQKPDGDCYEAEDVGCPYHGQNALRNKTDYYAPKKERYFMIKCPNCEGKGVVQATTYLGKD